MTHLHVNTIVKIVSVTKGAVLDTAGWVEVAIISGSGRAIFTSAPVVASLEINYNVLDHFATGFCLQAVFKCEGEGRACVKHWALQNTLRSGRWRGREHFISRSYKCHLGRDIAAAAFCVNSCPDQDFLMNLGDVEIKHHWAACERHELNHVLLVKVHTAQSTAWCALSRTVECHALQCSCDQLCVLVYCNQVLGVVVCCQNAWSWRT